jgi:hypothetical protein
MNNQCTAILKHLHRKPITALEALNKYGCLRLAARIHDLRNIGYKIKMVTVKTKDGKRIAKYFLGSEK